MLNLPVARVCVIAHQHELIEMCIEVILSIYHVFKLDSSVVAVPCALIDETLDSIALKPGLNEARIHAEVQNLDFGYLIHTWSGSFSF